MSPPSTARLELAHLHGLRRAQLSGHGLRLPRVRRAARATARGAVHAGRAAQRGDGVPAMAVAGFVGEQLLAVSLAGPSERLRRHQTTYAKALLDAKAQALRSSGTAGAPRRSRRA